MKKKKVEQVPIRALSYRKKKVGDNYVYSYASPSYIHTIDQFTFDSMVTDPLYVMFDDRNGKIFTFHENEKQEYRNILKIAPINKEYELNSGVLIDPMIYVTETDAYSEEEIEAFIKRTKKVHRKCSDPNCNTIIEVYRSDLKRGKGIFCSREHSNEHKSDTRIENVCGTCGMIYKSIEMEDFCCIECQEYADQN